MLLLTDRLTEGLRLQRTLARFQSCTVVALHQALAYPLLHTVIICDVDVDNVTTVQRLHAALAHHRSVAKVLVVFLTRDPSQLTLAQARATGAAAILPYHTPPALLIENVNRLTRDAGQEVARATQESGSGTQTRAREAGSALSDLLNAAKSRRAISMATLDRGGNAVLAAIGHSSIRVWLDVVYNYDDATYQHCLLVAGLVAAFAIELGLTLNNQRLLSQAALIHDIGKARIPYDILNKAGHLTEAETAVMRSHAVIGHQMLAGQSGLDPRILHVVRHHHEYLDGSGYPDKLRGNQVSRFVRLVTICDIYAALIERRSYKAPTSAQTALAVLADMGGKLDEGLVKAFRNVAGDM